MKKSIILFLIAMQLILASCKKSSDSTINSYSTSIVGTWQLISISGIQYYYGPNEGPKSATYSYSAPTLTITDTNNNKEVVTIDSDIWTFNSDYTFSIKETYIDSSSSSNVIVHSFSGNWEYAPSKIKNGAIELEGTNLPSIGPTGSTYSVQFSNSGMDLSVAFPDTNFAGLTTFDIKFVH
jgi:hypothetical protein